MRNRRDKRTVNYKSGHTLRSRRSAYSADTRIRAAARERERPLIKNYSRPITSFLRLNNAWLIAFSFYALSDYCSVVGNWPVSQMQWRWQRFGRLGATRITNDTKIAPIHLLLSLACIFSPKIHVGPVRPNIVLRSCMIKILEPVASRRLS